MTHDETKALAFDALNAACLHVQTEMGVTTGDVAGVFFSGSTQDEFLEMFMEYIKLERWCKGETP